IFSGFSPDKSYLLLFFGRSLFLLSHNLRQASALISLSGNLRFTSSAICCHGFFLACNSQIILAMSSLRGRPRVSLLLEPGTATFWFCSVACGFGEALTVRAASAIGLASACDVVALICGAGM